MTHNVSQHAWEPAKLWNKWYITILLLSMVSHAATQMVAPIVTEYAVSIGASLTVAGTVAGLMSLAALFLRPFSGRFSDKYNKKIIIMVSGAAMGLCMYAYAVFDSVEMIAVIRILHGVSFSFLSVALMAFNTAFVPKDKIGEGIGWMVVTQTVAFAVGPNLGLWLVEEMGYGACFFVAAVGCIAPNVALLVVPYRQTMEPGGKTKRFDINDFVSIRILPYALLIGLFSSCNGIVNSFLTMIGDERGIENVGIFFTVYSIVMIATRPVTGKLYDKKGVKFIMYPCIAISAASMILLGNASATWMVMVAGMLKALGQGSGVPSVQAHCLKQLGRDKAGVVSSTCYMGNDIGNALAPAIGGALATVCGSNGPMFIIVGIMIVVIGWPVLFFKTRYDERTYGADAAG